MFDQFRNTNKEQLKTNIFYWLCSGFVYSMLFWTLLNSILAILLVSFWLFFLKKDFDLRSTHSKFVLLFISLYVIGLIGLTYTVNMTKGTAILQKQSALLFFPLVFGTTSALSVPILKKLIYHYLIATGLACIAGLIPAFYNFFITGNTEAVTGRSLLVFHAFNPVIMGLYCLLALGFIITTENLLRHKYRNWFLVLSLTISLFIFLISIRIIIFCWFLLALFFIWKIISRNKYRIFLTVGLIFSTVIGGLLIPALKNQWIELSDFSGNNSIILDKDSSLERSWGGKALRIAIWQCSMDVISNHWLTGVGTGDTQDSLQQAYENRKFYFASRYNQYNAHNQYFQFGIGFGIPGMLLFILGMVYPFYIYVRKNLNGIYLIFLVIFAIAAMTESLLEVNKGIIWYSFFNSIFAFTYANQSTAIKK